MKDIATPVEQYAPANEIKLCYQTFGKQTDTPLLLIMGLATQMIHWDDLFCQQLADKGFWVIRFDNRDIGKSTKLSGARVPSMTKVLANQWFGKKLKVPYDLFTMAEDAIGLLDYLEVESANVVGVSMGGMIAQCMAIRYPKRVLSLTSIMSTTGNPKLPKPKKTVMLKVISPPPKDDDAFIDHSIKLWRLLHADIYDFDPLRTEDLLRRAKLRSYYPAGIWRQTCAILASADRTSMLQELTLPSLVMHGDADPLVPVECGIATAKALKNSKLKIYPGMGHTLPMSLWPDMIQHICNIAQ